MILEALQPNYALAQQVPEGDPVIRTARAACDSPCGHGRGLTPLGGYPGTGEEGGEMQSTLDPAKLMEDFFAGFTFRRDHPDSAGKVGAVGFCYGGGVVGALAVAAAGVPFYGHQPDPADVPAIQAPLPIHHAGLDECSNAGRPAFEAALKAAARITPPISIRA